MEWNLNFLPHAGFAMIVLGIPTIVIDYMIHKKLHSSLNNDGYTYLQSWNRDLRKMVS
jgi:hypothetical protein